MNTGTTTAAMKWRARGARLAGAVLLSLGVMAPVATVGLAAHPAYAQDKSAHQTPDKLILRTGKIIEGQVLEETDTQVKFMVVAAGIGAPRWFDKSEVLKIERGEVAPADPVKKDPVKAGDTRPTKTAEKATGSKVYMIELKGRFGEDITQTPIRDALKDARKNGADFLIFKMDNEWSANELEEIPADAIAGEFDELFRAEEMTPIFVNEIPREWEKQPKVIFWVKQAMGGAAFLPFICKDMYFASDARMGGIGNLSLMFGSTGDEVVRQKQESLRMGHAEGWAIVGGYDYRILKAMAQIRYVLSYKWVGGKPVFIEAMPSSPDEILLTDDGLEDRADSIQELARGQGNDVLTLDADTAKKLLISKGTVDTLDDLLFSLGISRNYQRVDDRSNQIMEGWTRALTYAKKDLRRLWQEFNEVQVQPPGDYSARSRARGARIAKLEEMKRIIRRFDEALNARFYRQYGIPGIADIDLIIEQIRQEQLADKR